jgi:hypothetical protein
MRFLHVLLAGLWLPAALPALAQPHPATRAHGSGPGDGPASDCEPASRPKRPRTGLATGNSSSMLEVLAAQSAAASESLPGQTITVVTVPRVALLQTRRDPARPPRMVPLGDDGEPLPIAQPVEPPPAPLQLPGPWGLPLPPPLPLPLPPPQLPSTLPALPAQPAADPPPEILIPQPHRSRDIAGWALVFAQMMGPRRPGDGCP